MLIDLKSFIRQLTAPNHRTPLDIGIPYMLFKPINHRLNRLNEWMEFAALDAGTPGQLAVMEFALQTYVSSGIRIVSVSSGNYDFRVLVPASLPDDQRGRVRELVDRWRLGSKRYEVVDIVSWSGTNPGVGLDWSIYPVLAASGSAFKIRFLPNKTGKFFTKITHVISGTVFLNQVVDYTGAEVAFDVTASGAYVVEVAFLRAEIGSYEVIETTVKPDWFVKIAVTMDAVSHETTFATDSTEIIQMNISKPSGLQPTGVDHNNSPWNYTTWQIGDTTYPQGDYERMFRWNPAVLGVDGLQPNTTYNIRVRRSSDPANVFVFSYTTPSTSVLTLTEIELEEEDPYESLPACDLGPSITSVVGVTQTRLEYRFHGNNVLANDQRLLNSLNVEVVRVTTVIATQSGGVITPVFPIGNQPHFTFPSQPPGVYTFQVRGGSCRSAWSAPVTITITEDGTPPEAAEGIWAGTRQSTVSGKKFTWVPSQNADIEITGAGKVKLVSPATKSALNGGATCNRFVYDENYTELPSGYLSDLISGTGIGFGNSAGEAPYGHYMYFIRYCTATTYAQIEADLSPYENDPTKFADFEVVEFSIEPA